MGNAKSDATNSVIETTIMEVEQVVCSDDDEPLQSSYRDDWRVTCDPPPRGGVGDLMLTRSSPDYEELKHKLIVVFIISNHLSSDRARFCN